MDAFAPAFPGELLPMSVITGFLGSGKSTLLGQLLRQPEMGMSAVIVNELGEVGLDHILVERIEGEVCLLQSGCICCSLRGDLEQALQKLIDQRERKVIPRFNRVLIETTGLADPAPILQLALTSPMIQRYFKLDAVVATVDAVNGDRQLDENPESVKQAALSDRILLTKTDLVSKETLNHLEARIATLNPSATQYRVLHGHIDASRLFNADPTRYGSSAEAITQWLGPVVGDAHHGSAHFHEPTDRVPVSLCHDSSIKHFCLSFDEPLDWLTVAEWLSDLSGRMGEKLLRIKGVLNLVGESRPIAIHAIHHTFHPPVALRAWPNTQHSSRIVFITRDLPREVVEESYRAFGLGG